MWYQRDNDIITINLYIQPGSKQTAISGVHGKALKIRVSALPTQGKANECLLKFIAQLFKVPIRQITVKRGEKSSYKTLVIAGSTVDPASLCEQTIILGNKE